MLLSSLVLCALIFLVVIAEHITLGRFWRRNELARRALGVATVLIIAGAGIPLGIVTMMDWLFFFFLFLSAGVGLVGAVVMENALEERKHISYLKGQYHQNQTDEGA